MLHHLCLAETQHAAPCDNPVDLLAVALRVAAFYEVDHFHAHYDIAILVEYLDECADHGAVGTRF